MEWPEDAMPRAFVRVNLFDTQFTTANQLWCSWSRDMRNWFIEFLTTSTVQVSTVYITMGTFVKLEQT